MKKGILSIMFALFLFYLCACGKSYNNNSEQTYKDSSYDDAYRDGYNAGYDTGYSEGKMSVIENPEKYFS